ncbi:hypothetical protein [uncultured Thiodictyon sp.]|nr:hypothetical protein [uncultured Thiodictyon sp.]
MLNHASAEHLSADALIATLEGIAKTDDERRLLATAKARVAKFNVGRRQPLSVSRPGAAPTA